MDQREFHLHPLGICYRLYHFIMKTLASQALKTVTLGRPLDYGSSSTEVPISDAAPRGSGYEADKVARPGAPCEDDDNKELPPSQGLSGDSISSPAVQAQEKNNPSMKEDEMENMALPTTSLPQAQAPKKMVSINENVEEIIPSKKKKKKRSWSFQKSSSLDQDEEEEEPKPLRSILKVSSNLNDKSDSIC